ncbi:hypothetical protein EMPG_12148, partial [Blastomyces silverae]
MDPFASPHDRPAPPTYDEDPPSYAFPGEPSVLDASGDNMTTSTPSIVRSNAASMRLLPSGESNLGNGGNDASDLGSAGRFRRRQNPPSRQQYVTLRDDSPAFNICTPTSTALKGVPRSALVKGKSTEDSVQPTQEKGTLSSGPAPSLRHVPMVSTGEALDLPTIPPTSKKQLRVTWKDEAPEQGRSPTQGGLGRTKTICRRKPRVSNMVPEPLRLASPKPPAHMLPQRADGLTKSITLSSLEKHLKAQQFPNSEKPKSDILTDNVRIRSPISMVRPSPQRYHPLHQQSASTSSLPPSRPSSSLGQAP